MAREKLCGAILAAGHGSITPGKSKLLENLNDKCTVIEAVVHLLDQQLDINRLSVAVNCRFGDALKAKINKSFRGISYARQYERRGAADAARLCMEKIYQEWMDEMFDDILVVYGDMPLWSEQSLAALIDNHRKQEAILSMFSVDVSNLSPTETVSQFGRILRDVDNNIIAVKEPYKMTDEDQEQWQKCQRVNPSAWVFKIDWLIENIPLLRPHDIPHELWLPDLVPLAVRQGKKILELPLADYREALGVNTAEDLAKAREIFKQMHCR
ncbi:hypothetical protein COU00_03220 [Candidatus Falkowbacteria bacterium CG10_big_fil_rev_8_21_14_0_10_43_11]|uniref:MobA-like NTP transferase domain-containing protein n=1 Tax=Candidatus Falkowbacteria bacterium CG10_big_fil_rev_8_21_14_0_10_43_11 TaxID=1974568 RepID=A0A2M6WLM6_9BACT|nr:MAG: hypothetical protein COU00_03220 [Candidatus Falkowbacteria bacterium CG10_big_fil_rev_8_21_14_0_10_43_11]